MLYYEGIFYKMNAVVYYSNTGQSRLAAEHLAKETGFSLLQMEEVDSASFECLITVFPIHCQSVPTAVLDFLRNTKAERLIPIATYGRMCYGNALHEIQKRTTHKIVAAAYLPARHSYLEGEDFSDYEILSQIVSSVNNKDEIQIPRSYKNPFASFFPILRGQIGIKMIRGEGCTGCDQCTRACPIGAMKRGRTSRRCIRCLRCIGHCPVGALDFKVRLPLRIYLRKKPINRSVIYTKQTVDFNEVIK